MTQAKKTTTKKLLVAAGIFIVIIGITIYLVTNKIKADQVESTPVITTDDIETVPASTLQSNPDSRAEVSVPILMYHHIRNYNDPNDTIGTNLSVPLENFDAQIKYLKDNGYSTVTFSDLLEFPTKKLAEKPVVITFDDGYSDAYANAYPELRTNNDVAVFYIISGFLGRADTITASQVKEMSDNGMEIGSHTIDHPDLTTLSATKMESELVQSKTAIEAIIGKSIISFCYPSGKNNSIVDAATKNAGYLTATTTVSGISTTSSDKFTLPRIRITPSDSLTTFANKLAGK
ncbi:MAG: polysaccharide deacetylase family protein [Candidatus Berkelbacteria bacterium]|nr:polysaccharide deacetylase family protein [Candidatus Berkelbacteria bacterium]